MHMNIYVKEPPLPEYGVCLDYMSLELACKGCLSYGRLKFQPLRYEWREYLLDSE